jgi:hypothetical protein
MVLQLLRLNKKEFNTVYGTGKVTHISLNDSVVEGLGNEYYSGIFSAILILNQQLGRMIQHIYLKILKLNGKAAT